MGCMGFGDPTMGRHAWTIDEASARTIIRHGLELGINFFDTAIAYQGGTSEQYVGRILRDSVPRDRVIVATKFMPRTPEEIAQGVTGQQHVKNMLDQSLRNLGMDYVDLYIVHAWDYNTPIEELLEGLSEAKRAGKLRAIGVSNCFAWQIAKANAIAAREGWPQFVSVQGHHNLLFREEEREMLPFCREEKIAMTPYSALAAGRLSRRPGEETRRLAQDHYAQFKYDATAAQDAIVIDRVAEVADARQVSMTEVALAWLLTKVDAPVVGATKLHHVDGAVKALSLRLSAQEIGYLEEAYVPHALVGMMATNKPRV